MPWRSIQAALPSFLLCFFLFGKFFAFCSGRVFLQLVSYANVACQANLSSAQQLFVGFDTIKCLLTYFQGPRALPNRTSIITFNRLHSPFPFSGLQYNF
jgi:hypothetical protein